MERIEVTNKESIEVKRFHLPLIINCKCPKCNTLSKHDFNNVYLSYPKINEEETIGVFCDTCKDFFDKKIVLKIAVEVWD